MKIKYVYEENFASFTPPYGWLIQTIASEKNIPGWDSQLHAFKPMAYLRHLLK